MDVTLLLSKLPDLSCERNSYGEDLDIVNKALLGESDKEKKKEIILSWIKRKQPCMLGRLASTGKQNIQLSVYVVDDNDIALGQEHLKTYLQACRLEWKQACSKGKSDAVLYFFNIGKLIYLPPSDSLVEVFKGFSNLIFNEYAPVNTDVIYTEAAPLIQDGKLFLYKAGINFFHTTAHHTANHDRRVPGGAIISINSVGHYANNMVNQGFANDLDEAVKNIQRLAWQSIGNGGISLKSKKSTSWHNIDPVNTCPHLSRPSTVLEGFSEKKYSANYHTDVLIPDLLTRKVTDVDDPAIEKWKWLTIEYFTTMQYELGSIDFGMFHGYPVDHEAINFNPFPPIRGVNSPKLIY